MRKIVVLTFSCNLTADFRANSSLRRVILCCFNLFVWWSKNFCSAYYTSVFAETYPNWVAKIFAKKNGRRDEWKWMVECFPFSHSIVAHDL